MSWRTVVISKRCKLDLKMGYLGVRSEETKRIFLDEERYVMDLSYELQFDGVCTKLTTSSLIKGCGIELCDDYDNLCEKIVDYMELMREFKGIKLFITVNMRNYFEYDVVQQFCNTVLNHKLTILMIEATTYPLLNGEKRITIDKDMCVF